ncbi:hypothetical protein E3J84_07280 [Candidatus Aerophobetes bacterium]|uniref:Uncharacterized protein n=1 Tax=Aerophobetes bacterium TaxID=2030807 RepID=A0A523RP87_UNCAE|nr:MAG: hypothetical protein E3J84_07280 [Candidatus Aerophobetes bacterium]
MGFQKKDYFVKEGCLRKEDEKKFHPFVFKVPSGIQEIQISFGYSPGTLKDRQENYQRIKEAVQEYTKEVETEKQRNLILDFLLKKAYPLRNFLTLAVYNAKGNFIGAAHRYRYRENSKPAHYDK